jgi:S-disulfanyl-L-cysteine oxidoreductase SoxD
MTRLRGRRPLPPSLQLRRTGLRTRLLLRPLVAGAVVVAVTATFIVRARAQAKPASLPATFGIGRPATPTDIAKLDIDIGPDGVGLPPGRGTAADGAPIYAARCAGCHGKTGKEGPNDVLVGRTTGQAFPFASDGSIPKTIGSYWPYATTLFDYVRRAMPPDAPGSLKDEEVYALVALLLAWNEIIPNDAVMDGASLAKVRMPARDRFVPDPRSTPKGKPPR